MKIHLFLRVYARTRVLVSKTSTRQGANENEIDALKVFQK